MKKQLERTTKALLERLELAANDEGVPTEVVAEMATAAAQLATQIGDKKETAGYAAVLLKVYSTPLVGEQNFALTIGDSAGLKP